MNNNSNIEDVRNQQRQLIIRHALNQMQKIIKIEREDMRIQKNERRIVTTKND
jgi:hypothetical protein